jgi:drug/metabolite transporter (DMT)-like permease
MGNVQRKQWIGFICLGVTASGWALNWPLMKILLQDWPPLFARGLAGVIASLILGVIVLGRRQSLKVPRETIPRLLQRKGHWLRRGPHVKGLSPHSAMCSPRFHLWLWHDLGLHS